MSDEARPSSLSGFSLKTCSEGQPKVRKAMPHTQQQTREDVNEEELVGSINEAIVILEGIALTELLDTGSSVSTVSVTQLLYDQHLSQLELFDIGQLSNIECADGNALPYSGYVKAEIAAPVLGKEGTSPCLLLVMPETKYSQHTPVLLGTNFLTRIMKDCSSLHGTNYLQRVAHESSWHLAFRCVGLREKQLAKPNNRIAVLRSVEHKRITIRPNEKVAVRGYLDKPQPYQRTCALLQPHPQVTTDLDLQPSLISYSPQST